ncbi:MAG: inositol monophosphatase [Chloroflexi bacterium]|nr:inositol monophosphatase [Chloroflexota bacterium]MCL5075344.1 inositol monophosphatase [Chloroflexota bacterium]
MQGLLLSESGWSQSEVAIAAAKAAGETIRQHFGAIDSFDYKGRANILTHVDLRAEEQIISLIRREFPTHNILSEESDRIENGSEYTWVIDPLDGTLNYACGIGFFSVSIALIHTEETRLGVIYDPLREETFLAEQGKGAFLNGVRIVSKPKTSLLQSNVGFDLGHNEEERAIIVKVAQAICPYIQCFRVLGSAALGLAYTAVGRLDLYFHRFLYPWDMAAARLIVAEAGGRVTDWEGKPCLLWSRSIIVAGAQLHKEFLELIERLGLDFRSSRD